MLGRPLWIGFPFQQRPQWFHPYTIFQLFTLKLGGPPFTRYLFCRMFEHVLHTLRKNHLHIHNLSTLKEKRKPPL